MTKRSEFIGEFIVTINENNSVSVSRIYKSTKAALTEIAKANGIEVQKSWTTQDLGRRILTQLCNGERKGQVGEYTIEREDNNRINVLRTYSNTKEGLRQAANIAGYSADAKEKGWNTQEYGRHLIAFVQGKEENPSVACPQSTNKQLDTYPSYLECVEKYAAQSGIEEFTFADDGETIIEIIGEMDGALIIPEGVTKISIKYISDNVTAIIMPDSVTSCKNDFRSLDNLKFIRISPNLKYLPKNFCKNTPLEEIKIPSGIKVIGESAFSNCKQLKKIELPATVEFILSDAFSYCEIKEIEFPDSLKVIFDGAFSGNKFLKNVTFASASTMVMCEAFEPGYDSGTLTEEMAKDICQAHPMRSDVVFGADDVKYQTREELNWRNEPTGEIFTYVSVPLWYVGVLVIKEGTNKSDTDLKDVHGITELTIPASFKMDYNFNYPPFIKKLRLPDCIEDVDISSSEIEELNVPKEAKSVKISNAKISSLDIPEGVTFVDLYNLENLAKVYLPSLVEKICISKLPINQIIIPESVTELLNGCFSGCNMIEEIVFPNGISEIPRLTFETYSKECRLKKVKLPDNLKIIGDKAFRGQTALEEITIPESVTLIDTDAFAGCTSLKKINFLGQPRIKVGAFRDCPGYDMPELTLTTQEYDDQNHPVVRLRFGRVRFRKCDYDTAYDLFSDSNMNGHGIFIANQSSDPDRHPLDNTSWLAECSSSTDGIECYNDDECDDCENTLYNGYMMFASFDTTGEDEYEKEYKLCENTAKAMALIADPRLGLIADEDFEPYSGPEAIIDLEILDIDDFDDTNSEPIFKQKYLIHEVEGNWKASEL